MSRFYTLQRLFPAFKEVVESVEDRAHERHPTQQVGKKAPASVAPLTR
ncbi:MAG: hypothetical protein HY661_06090 [Betaproteobacteria bacterium]|nr:hypothetical protein [Betaproteobacteria bacterium]